MFQYSYFIILIIIKTISANEYHWPINAGKNLTAVYGEERPGRYHTGLDIRTFGHNGLELYAIDNGYISRVRTSSKGYGKAIYIKLDDGNVAVYAHLERFTPLIDNIVYSLQTYSASYTIDHSLKPNKYRVKKGDIIGYSGDTGGVSGPHLHFEIRDSTDNTINPLNTSLSIFDNLSPIAKSIAFIPLDKNTLINGYNLTKVFSLKYVNNQYVLNDTISIKGKFGIAGQFYDRINNQPFNYGIYNLDLMVDAKFIYSSQYDKIDFENASKLYTERNYSLKKLGLGKFYHLFSYKNNTDLPFVNNKSQSEININSDNLFHDAIINVRDYSNNNIQIKIIFRTDTLPTYDYEILFIENECIIRFNEDEKIRPKINLLENYHSNDVVPANHYLTDFNTFKVANYSPTYNIIQISALNKNGIASKPTYHMNTIYYPKTISGNYKLKEFDHGIFISFIEDNFTGLDINLTLENNKKIKTINMERISKFEHISEVLSPSDIAGFDVINVSYPQLIPEEYFLFELNGQLYIPDSTIVLKSIDNEIIIQANQSFSDTTFIWLKSADYENPKEGEIIKGPYFIGPNLIPFINEMILYFEDSKDCFNDCGIFYYDDIQSEWSFLSNEYKNNQYFSKIFSGGTFALIKESNSPTISNLIPDLNGTYYSKDITTFSFNVTDSFAGIDGEIDIEIMLNQNKLIFEYNSYQNKITYNFPENLNSGTHYFSINATDKLGNNSKINGQFFIK